MKMKYRVFYGDHGSHQDFSTWKEAAAFAKYALLEGYSLVKLQLIGGAA